mgnify:FL=1
MKIINFTSLTSGRAVSNQFIINSGNDYVFQSYMSLIASYNDNTKVLLVSDKWNYSKTTLKYFYQFLREYTPYTVRTRQVFERIIKNNKDKIKFVEETELKKL